MYDFENFDGDVELIKEFIDDVAGITEDYPELINSRKPIQIRNSFFLDDQTYAETRKHIISINGYAFRNRGILEQDYKKKADKKWFVPGTDFRSIAAHECGHVIVNTYKLKKRGIILRIFPDADMDETTKFIAKNISIYASVNSDELIAEAFSAYRSGDRTELVLKVLDTCGILNL